MTNRPYAAIWRRWPLRHHQTSGKVDRSMDPGKESPMVEGDYGAGRDRQGSTSQGESTLLPMLIAGLVSVVVGLVAVAYFV